MLFSEDFFITTMTNGWSRKNIGEAVLSGEKKLVFVFNNLNLRMTQNCFHDRYSSLIFIMFVKILKLTRFVISAYKQTNGIAIVNLHVIIRKRYNE